MPHSRNDFLKLGSRGSRSYNLDQKGRKIVQGNAWPLFSYMSVVLQRLCIIVGVVCSNDLSVVNGWVDLESAVYGGIAVYKCNTGYVRRGNPYRTCLENGQWSEKVPTCEGKGYSQTVRLHPEK